MRLFDYAIKVAIACLVVLGSGIVVIALSGVDMGRLDDHPVLRYRLPAAAVLIVAYLLVDHLFGRRRRRQGPGVATTAGQAPATSQGGYAAELLALGLVAAGAAAFWHDHMTHEIPNPVAVSGEFVGARCLERESSRSRMGPGPHMAITYRYPSQSTQARPSQIRCLTTDCPPPEPAAQAFDTETKRVPYASLQACTMALPAVLAERPPAMVWTGDKDPDAAIRARFTPERDPPPYFLIWIPLAVAAVVLSVSVVRRRRWTSP